MKEFLDNLNTINQEKFAVGYHVIILLHMSLLTSPQTTKDQQRFLNKMEREFNRRSFHNINYVQPPNLLQQVNDNTDRAQQQIKLAIDNFLDRLSQIIAESHNSRIDYYFILNQMKSADFFSDVSGLIGQDLLQRNTRLQKENNKQKEQIKKIMQRVRELERGEQQNHTPTPDLRYNGIKSIAENLYEKAKVLSAQQFTTLCDRTLLGEKVIIKKVAPSKGEEDVLKRVATLLEGAKGPKEQQLAELINELSRQLKEPQRCNQPCCQTIQEDHQFRQSKASILRRSCQARRPSDIYKNDRSQQYFNRYYRRSQFDMKKVTSVEKTKLQQMQKIEDDYRINLKQRKKKNFSMLP